MKKKKEEEEEEKKRTICCGGIHPLYLVKSTALYSFSNKAGMQVPFTSNNQPGKLKTI